MWSCAGSGGESKDPSVLDRNDKADAFVERLTLPDRQCPHLKPCSKPHPILTYGTYRIVCPFDHLPDSSRLRKDVMSEIGKGDKFVTSVEKFVPTAELMATQIRDLDDLGGLY